MTVCSCPLFGTSTSGWSSTELIGIMTPLLLAPTSHAFIGARGLSSMRVAPGRMPFTLGGAMVLSSARRPR